MTQRMKRLGQRWTNGGRQDVLTLRALAKSERIDTKVKPGKHSASDRGAVRHLAEFLKYRM